MLSDHHLGSFKNCICEMSTYWSNRILTLGLRDFPQDASLPAPCEGFSDAHAPQLASPQLAPSPDQQNTAVLFFFFLRESEHRCGRCWHRYSAPPPSPPSLAQASARQWLFAQRLPALRGIRGQLSKGDPFVHL